MTEPLPAPGQNIFIPCKKCAADRYHKILAHTGDRKAKVECEVCHAKKTYTQPKPKKPRKSKPRSKKNQGPELPSWDTLNSAIGTNSINSYKMTGNFEAQSALQHPSFGLGFITAVTPNKIEVVFKEGVRLLVHNYTE